jgi:hypothetical protein
VSLAGDRLALMQALGDLEWVTGFQYPPNGGYKSGDAWPLVTRIDYPNRFGGVVFWEVLVVLHADVATAEMLMDTHIPAVRTALVRNRDLVITSVTPRLLQFEQGSALIVAVIAGTREES